MSTLASKTFPSFKTLYKNLTKELLVIQNKAGRIHAKKDKERRIATLQYKKMALIKTGADISGVEAEIISLKTDGFKTSKTLEQSALLKSLVAGDAENQATKADLNNLANIATFLKSQRTYTELLERYNPGLTMTQGENVSRSANRVGLSVPE